MSKQDRAKLLSATKLLYEKVSREYGLSFEDLYESRITIYRGEVTLEVDDSPELTPTKEEVDEQG